MTVNAGGVYMDVAFNTSKISKDLAASVGAAAPTAAAALAVPFERRLAEVGAKTANVGKGMTAALTLPIVGLGALATKEFTSYERSLASIEGLVGANQQQMELYTSSVRDIGVEFGVGADAAADALYFITSSGLEGAAAIDVLRQSAKASAAGLGELPVVADLLTSAMNAYGPEVLSAAKATDVLTVAVREGKGEPAEMADALGRVLPIASQLGVGFDEVAATFAVLSKNGNDAHESATQVRSILAALLKPSQQAEAALDGVGTSSAELRKMMGEQGLLPTLQYVNDKLGDNSAATALVFDDVRALTGVMGILNKNATDTGRIFDATAAAGGELDDALDVMKETEGFKLNQALAELRDSLIDVGAVAVPMITKVAQGVAVIAGAFDMIPGPAKSVVVGLAGVLAIAGPLVYVGGKLAKTIGFVVTQAERFAGAGIDRALDSVGKTSETAAAGSEKAASGMSKIGSGAAAGAIAITGIAIAYSMWNAEREKAAAAAAGVGDQIVGNLDGIDDAREKIGAINDQVHGLSAEIESSSAPWDADYRADISVLGAELQATGNEIVAWIGYAEDLAEATGGSADAAFRWIQEQAILGKTFDSSEAALTAYLAAVDGGEVKVDNLESKTREANDAFDAQREAVSKLQGEFLGYTGAQQSYQDAVDSVAEAQRSAESAARSVSTAQRGVDDAQRSAARAARGYEDALRGVEDAQRAVDQAQQELDDTLSGEEDQIALERARIRVEEARRKMTEPFDDELAKRSAELDLRQSEIDLARMEAEVAGRPGEREAALEEAQRRLTDANQQAEDARLSVADADRKVTDSSIAVRDAQLRSAEAADAVRDAQDKAGLAALDLYGKQGDLAAAFRDEQGAASDMLDELLAVRDAYPEVAGAIDPYIAQLRALIDLRDRSRDLASNPDIGKPFPAGSGMSGPQGSVPVATPPVTAPTRDPDRGAAVPQAVGSGLALAAPAGAGGGNSYFYNLDGMPADEAFEMTRRRDALDLSLRPGG